MAINKVPSDSKLKLVLSTIDADNKAITKTKTFGNVKVTAENQAVYDVAVDLSGLQEYTLTSVKKFEEFELVEE